MFAFANPKFARYLKLKKDDRLFVSSEFGPIYFSKFGLVFELENCLFVLAVKPVVKTLIFC